MGVSGEKLVERNRLEPAPAQFIEELRQYTGGDRSLAAALGGIVQEENGAGAKAAS